MFFFLSWPEDRAIAWYSGQCYLDLSRCYFTGSITDPDTRNSTTMSCCYTYKSQSSLLARIL